MIYGLIVGLILRYASPARTITQLRVVEQQNGLTSQRSANSSDVAKTPPDSVILKFNLSSNDREETKVSEKTFLYKFLDEYHEDSGANEVQAKATFNPELFFYVFLPPIIFNAGYSMRKKQFFDNFGAIIAFAMIGTSISTVVIAVVMYGFAQLISSVEVKFLDSLYFGAIISATDPVTTLAIFQVKCSLNSNYVTKFNLAS